MAGFTSTATTGYAPADSRVEGGLIAVAAIAISPLGYLAIPLLGAWTLAAAQALFSAQGAFGTVSVTENLSGRGLSSWAGFVEELDLQEVPGTNRAAYTGSFRLRVEE